MTHEPQFAATCPVHGSCSSRSETPIAVQLPLSIGPRYVDAASKCLFAAFR